MRYTSENPAHIGTIVFLDGIQVEDCVEADTSAGYIIKVKRDDEGHICHNGEFITYEKLTGVVTAKEPA